MTVSEVIRQLVRDPVGQIVARWNWKAAVLSGAMRAAIFFTANLSVSPQAAVQALLVDLSFRLPLVGICAAFTQAFESAQPAWAASLCVMVLVPAIAHSVEFTVHFLAGTPVLKASIAASVAFSVLSTLFNLFAMRRGVLVVGTRSGSLAQDLRRLPAISAQFLMAGPLAMRRAILRVFERCGGAQ